MVTAGSQLRAPGARTYAGPRQLLWLAVLLFSLVLTHGLSVESAEGHSAPAPGTAASAPAAVAHAAVAHVPDADAGTDSDPGPGHGPEQDSRHAADECLSGQPEQGPELDGPCLAPRTWDPGRDRAAGSARVPGAEPAVIPLAASRCSVVRQV